mgnify:CR=1 FL=1
MKKETKNANGSWKEIRIYKEGQNGGKEGVGKAEAIEGRQ